MKHSPMIFGLALGWLLAIMIPSQGVAEPQWNVGIQGGSKGIEGFHFSVGEFYRIPAREVVVVHDRGIDEEELPVVYFLAQRAHVAPAVIVDMRLGRMSWMDITMHFGLSPEIYYVPLSPPYGKAYGYYRHHPRHTWKRMRLHDDEIVNQVNLYFISRHYGYSPDRIMRYRSEGRGFIIIDHDIRSGHYGKVSKKKLKRYDDDDDDDWDDD